MAKLPFTFYTLPAVENAFPSPLNLWPKSPPVKSFEGCKKWRVQGVESGPSQGEAEEERGALFAH